MLPYRFFHKSMGRFDLSGSQLPSFAVAFSFSLSTEYANIHARLGYWEIGFGWNSLTMDDF